MNSNNPLAVEPETENDAALEIFSVTLLSPFISLRLQRRLERHDKDFFK
jgi:hypothetical protein